MANTKPGVDLGSVTIEAPIKTPMESGIVQKLVISIVASIAAVLATYSDSIQMLLMAVMPAGFMWVIPLILQGISWCAQFFAVKERTNKPDMTSFYKKTSGS